MLLRLLWIAVRLHWLLLHHWLSIAHWVLNLRLLPVSHRLLHRRLLCVSHGLLHRLLHRLALSIPTRLLHRGLIDTATDLRRHHLRLHHLHLWLHTIPNGRSHLHRLLHGLLTEPLGCRLHPTADRVLVSRLNCRSYAHRRLGRQLTLRMPHRLQMDLACRLPFVLYLEPFVDSSRDTKGRKLDDNFCDFIRACEVLVINRNGHVIADVLDIDVEPL